MITTNGNAFRATVKGKNIMTPDVLGYYKSGQYIVELAEGTGFGGDMIYGVTVVKDAVHPIEREHMFNLSKMFYDKKEATDYIDSLAKVTA